MIHVTYFGLRETCPALDQFEQAGRQAAETGWSGWLSWLAGFREFTRAVEEAAQASGVSFTEARRIILDHLGAVYQHERHRLTTTTQHEPAAARVVRRPAATADHRPRAEASVPRGARRYT